MTDPYVCHINGNIYHQQKPPMLAYIPYMDPMGYGNHQPARLSLNFSFFQCSSLIKGWKASGTDSTQVRKVTKRHYQNE